MNGGAAGCWTRRKGEICGCPSIAAKRRAVRRITAGVRGPARFRPDVRQPAHCLHALVRPEVREPAHFSALGSREALVTELRAVLQKFGM